MSNKILKYPHVLSKFPWRLDPNLNTGIAFDVLDHERRYSVLLFVAFSILNIRSVVIQMELIFFFLSSNKRKAI